MGIEITHLTRRGREQGSPTWVGEGGNKRSASTLSQASRPGGEVPCIATCSLCACGAEGGSVDDDEQGEGCSQSRFSRSTMTLDAPLFHPQTLSHICPPLPVSKPELPKG